MIHLSPLWGFGVSGSDFLELAIGVRRVTGCITHKKAAQRGGFGVEAGK